MNGRLAILLAGTLGLAACQGGITGPGVTAAASTAASVVATAQPAVSTAASAALSTAAVVVSTAAPAVSTAASSAATQAVAVATTAANGAATTAPTVAASQAAATAAPAKPLQLAITAPANETVVTVPQVAVTGQAPPDAVITINDTIVVVGANGQFSATVPLQEGPNELDVVASDVDGNTATSTLFVTYDPAG